MSAAEINGYEETLRAKQAEFQAGFHNRDAIEIEKVPDSLDNLQLANERDFAIRQLDREAGLLRQVRAALERIADGSYGVCLSCGAEINPKRLAAVPWAAYCRRCQEALDLERKPEGNNGFDRALREAA